MSWVPATLAVLNSGARTSSIRHSTKLKKKVGNRISSSGRFLASFRPPPQQESILKFVPPDIASGLGFLDGPCGPKAEACKDLSIVKPSHLNTGAFGKANPVCVKLAESLNRFAENEPDVWFDQVCLPLVERCREYIAAELFGRDCAAGVLFTPNCTIGMKGILESLVFDERHRKIGYLAPLYGATKELLGFLQKVAPDMQVQTATPGIFEESAEKFVSALDKAYSECKFSVLVTDHVSSQTARIAPLDAVADWCKKNSVILVVDGTHNHEKFARSAALADYYVLSTHKWLGNAKTCGIIAHGEKMRPPRPHAVTFGYNEAITEGDRLAAQNWMGMTSNYVQYVTLARAVNEWTKLERSGEIEQASADLKDGILNVLQASPILQYSSGESRTMNFVKIPAGQFDFLKVSEKGRWNEPNTPAEPQVIQDYLQQTCGVFVSVKQFEDELYLRLSCNLQNSIRKRDLQLLANVLNHTMSFNQAFVVSNKADRKNLLRQQVLYMFDTTERLFSTLKTRAYFMRCERLRHHLIFYFGHVSCFYINKLVSGGFLKEEERPNPKFESLFSVGVDEMSWDDLFEDNYEWPIWRPDQAKKDENGVLRDPEGRTDEEVLKMQESYLENVRKYRMEVRDLVLRKIDNLDGTIDRASADVDPGIRFLDKLNPYSAKEDAAPLQCDPSLQEVLKDSFWWIIAMGTEHEKIHAETSSVIINQAPLEHLNTESNSWSSVYPVNYPAPTSSTDAHNELVDVPGGKVKVGRVAAQELRDATDHFGWDNEFGSEHFELQSFKCSQKLVSNAEYFEFVKDGGYAEKKWWTKEGWGYVEAMQVSEPRFWIQDENSRNYTKLRFMLEEMPMPWKWPVFVNNLEAAAFCRWKSHKTNKQLRLISHEEQSLLVERVKYTENATDGRLNNNNLATASPVNVDVCSAEVDGQKIYDPIGNVWRHSCSVLTVLPGFKTHRCYDDFTLPTIDGHHNHIVGGSFISLGNCAAPVARYGFRRHFYQYAGIRYVESPETNVRHDVTVPMIYDGVELGKYVTENYWMYTRAAEWTPPAVWRPGHIEQMFSDAADVAAASSGTHDDALTQLCKENLAPCNLTPVPNFPVLLGVAAGKTVAADSIPDGEVKGPTNILVAYGGVGRLTLELIAQLQNTEPSRKFEIYHTDPTANKLQVLEGLLATGRIQWQQIVEGDIADLREYILEDTLFQQAQTDKTEVMYYQNPNDYVTLRSQLEGPFDYVVADFRKSLVESEEEVVSLVNSVRPGGTLILSGLVVPNASDGVFVPRVLTASCELVNEVGVFPHIFKETRNKHQFQVSQVSIWRKTSTRELSVGGVNAHAQVNHGQRTEAYYEDKLILDSYYGFHFKDEPILGNVQNLSLAMARYIDELCTKYDINRGLAMDAGCGPGRVAIELATKHGFSSVEAFDYSQSFVDLMHREIKRKGGLHRNVTGYQGDAHKMDDIVKTEKPEGKFDVVFCCNLIDRLADPIQYLQAARKLVKSSGGLIIISSPYTWKVEHTPTENWIGGKFVDGEKSFTQHALTKFFAGSCEDGFPKADLLETKRIPFVIADADMTFQVTYSYCTVFRT